MSTTDPIIINDISSEDEEEEEHHQQADNVTKTTLSSSDNASSVLNIDDRRVYTYMEVTGMSRDNAITQLSKFQQNLDLCILAHFDQVSDELKILDRSKNDEICTSKMVNKGEPENMEQKSLEKASLRTRKTNQLLHVSDHNLIHEPSKAWKDTVERCRELQVQFVDQDFPPNSTSLDGRRQQPQTTASQTSASEKNDSQVQVIKCRCGVPACVKTVQRDGPNYGRFFLACGKSRPSKHKRNPKRKRENTDKKEDDVILIDDVSTDSNTKVVRVGQEQTSLHSERQCQFFQWDDNHTQSNHFTKNQILDQLTWFRFEAKHGHSLIGPNPRYSPNHVRQGAMGDCWFLSALAVVAEKSYLIQRLLPHDKFNNVGCYEVYFCLDGRWKSTVVDSLLPAIARNANKQTKKGGKNSANAQSHRQIANNKRGSFQTQENIVIQPAFAAGNISWPAIIEKAYAKVHGSYSRLSGGFISEAFYDLTGAPIERVCFRKVYDYDELFARLLSFSNAGFLMGVATNAGGDGLVSCHAYSLLGVYEIHGAVVGEQKKVTNFFTKKDDDNDVIFVKDSREERELGEARISSVRLVRIRNPWGVREWKGKWSATSAEWTSKIKRTIGDETCKQGDGTFFMSYEDMIQRFDHMDVAKCQEGWKRTSRGGAMKLHQTRDVLFSCSLVYLCQVKERTWAFVSLVQKKKRANATTQFWYTDLSIIVLKRKGEGNWEKHQCYLQGVERACDCELFLDPEYEYCFISFSFLSGREELEFGAQAKKSAPFQFTTYSANDVFVRAQVRSSLGHLLPLETLHLSLLQMTKKITHAIGPHAVLVTVNGNGCIYFLMLNAGPCGIALNLKIEQNRGMAIVHGEKSSTHNIPSKTQCVALVLANDGRNNSPSIDFNFKTDSTDKQQSATRTNYPYRGLDTKMPLNLAGELLCSSVDSEAGYRCSRGTIDERLWSSVL